MKNNTYLTKAQSFLSNGQIPKCINLLKENIKDTDILNQILQLEIRNNNLIRKVNIGTIDFNDSQLEENRISNSLLMIISNLAKENKNSVSNVNTHNEKSLDFKWIIIGVLGLALTGLVINNFIGSEKNNPASTLDLCENVICLNGGECENGKCICPEGYEGERCEKTIASGTTTNPCDNVNCQNNGQCVNGKCKCPDGYSGKYCQIKDKVPPPPTKPDLKITDFQMKPKSPIQNEKVYMQAIVKNLGQGNSGKFKIKWWAGENFPDPAFQKSFGGLNAGEQHIFNIEYDGYKSWYGEITSKLEIDGDNVVKESNENNNVLKKSYPVKKKTTPIGSNKPDLKITAFQMNPESPIQSKKISMQAIVKNIGQGNSGRFKIKWWAGENFPNPAFQKTFDGLNAGEQHIFSFKYDGYKSWYGEITSKLEIDGDNVVKESNENNNVLKKSYPVKKKN